MVRGATAALVAILGAGCVDSLSVEERPCPCDVSTHYCCPLTNYCLRKKEQVCAVPEGSFYPLTVGAKWEYLVSDDGVETTRIRVMGPEEDVPLPDGFDVKPPSRGFKMRTDSFGPFAPGPMEHWEGREGTAVVRHHERAFDHDGGVTVMDWWQRGRLRVDENPEKLEVGTEWISTHARLTIQSGQTPLDPATIRDRWRVMAFDERVEVPAGVFHCLRLRRDTDKSYWFARGIGKIKEVGKNGDETEVLVRYTPP